MNLDNVNRDDWIVGGLALLLVLDVLILPWFSLGGTVTVGSATLSFGGSLTGTDGPDSLLGILGVLAALLVIVDLAVERLSPQTEIPSIGGSRTTTRLVLAGAAAAFLALKFLLQLSHFSNLGVGFWAGVVLSAGLVYVAMQARNAATSTAPAGPGGPPAPAQAAGPAAPGGPPPPAQAPEPAAPAGPPPAAQAPEPAAPPPAQAAGPPPPPPA